MENMQCTDTVDTALAELVGLNRSLNYYTRGTTTISSSPFLGGSTSSGWNRAGQKFPPHFTCQGPSISSASINQDVQTNPKYISKILNSPRNATELPPFRMRPYFIPERSRTKSESLDMTSSNVFPEMIGTEMQTQVPFNTCTTNSASYSMISATLMDTTSSSRSPGILMPPFDYEVSEVEPRKMRLKKMNLLKKSKSLEDVRAETVVDGSQLSHEMEFVSSRIQKLKVQEQE